MSSATETVTPVHTVVSSRLGEITLVRHADAVVGSYFAHRW
jgi:methylated-DNA-[protein]-cysteine S-methyltransferase